MILGGDVGGTKTNLGLFRADGARLEPIRVERFLNAGHASLEAILALFLADERAPIEAACVGVAGPVVAGTADATNLPWLVSERELARKLGTERVEVVNDLVATAEGIPALADEDVGVVAAGVAAADAAQLVVAAGTGLGVAYLVPVGGGLVAHPSEAGHATFAPQDEEQHALARALRERYGRVSNERVVSGPGLVDVYEHLGARGMPPDDEAFQRRWRAGERGVLVTEYALDKRSERTHRALELFVSCYGAVAGDLALATLARGGVWIGGGIAPAIEAALCDGTFLASFVDKGRLRPLVEAVPVRVIRNPLAALHGAARRAARLR